MANYQTYYTRAGQALSAKLHAQGNSAGTPFTRAMTGAGEYTPDEDLRDRTTLKDPRQTVGFSAAPSIVNDTNVLLRFMITNLPPEQEITVPYDITEIGIFANDPDEGEILYALLLPDDHERLDQMTPYDGRQAACIYMAFTIAVADAEVAYIVAGSGAFALADDFISYVQDQGGRRHARVTIKKTTWVSGDEEQGAHVDIPADWATPDYWPQVTVDISSARTACACGLAQYAQSGAGIITLYADSVPDDEISVFIFGQRIDENPKINAPMFPVV